ncbi:MAG: sulfotransferase domain-containing protein, partial [Candidatus Roseilinea sp.]|uniref:sulfotransferase domain-containing protein n=1 Tax=Candidatus Roseilinea sp. TaxID=2838777 RepID=UPI00404AE3E0
MQESFRILIVSTPKTGNTWLAYLMADIYGLPIRELPLEFTLKQIEQLGPRWVVIQHPPPKSSLLNWLHRNNVHLLTTLRHPCDTLVSLLHYATGLALIPETKLFMARAMTADWGKYGPNVIAFVRTHFKDHVRLSAEWLWLTDSIGVRYEDLWRDPVGVVQAVTQRIREVPLDRIERSVERCDLSLMRSLAGRNSSFFRKGGSGHWKDELPAEVIDIFRHELPYPQLFAALGYSLDTDERARPVRVPRRLQNPFAGIEQFDNGAPILPFIKAAYWHIDPHTASAFAMPISRTDPEGTFWAWLNAPAHDDPRRDDPDLPIISQIAKWVYDMRPDLQQAMPDVYGAHRAQYIDWYIRQAHIELNLSEAYIRPVFERYTAWGNAPASGYNGDPSLPPLTNLMVALPEQYDILRRRFPDIAGLGRLQFVIWFL